MVVTKLAHPSVAASGLDCKNLLVGEIITHRVFERGSDKTIKAPKLSVKLMKLPPEGRDALQERVTSALGSKSHGIEVSIERVEQDSFFQTAAHMLHVDAKNFVTASQELAKKLAAAQGTTTAPAGMLIVVRGRIGNDSKPCIVVLKADVHDGFGTESNDDVDVKYLDTLLLTPTQRLFKVALLLEMESDSTRESGEYDEGDYRAYLFDHLITAVETRSAAAYFYDTFLGMGIAKSSKKLTSEFYEGTLKFIASAPITADKKWDLREALRVELRNESNVINAATFAKTNFPVELRKPYQTFMKQSGFPASSIPKDVAYVISRLRKPRQLKFESGVKVWVPADAEPGVLQVVSRNAQETVVKIRGDFKEKE